MARNEEKSLTLFNKWQTFKSEFHSSVGNRRPLMAQDCDSLADAEKWRRELIRDITKKISHIHNASLGEHRIREINDEINKMSRQKHFWEMRIRELGGNTSKGRQFIDIEGKELPGAPGYKYYGAAKELPGVRELFAAKDNEINLRRQKRTRGDMYKNITPDYYGYRDDDDGILKAKEAEREKELIAAADDEFAKIKGDIIARVKAAHEARLRGDKQDAGLSAEELAMLEDDSEEDETTMSSQLAKFSDESKNKTNDPARTNASASAANNAELRSHVAVPTQADMQTILLEEKKKLMLERLL